MGRNILKLDTSGFERLITDLDRLGGNVKKAVDDALTQAGETITDDTIDAVSSGNLPAKGKYSSKEKDTRHSIVENPHVEWAGTLGEMGVGFDFGKRGAGGYLISGTPKMAPDYELQRIYKRKTYMKQIQKDMAEVVTDYINEALGG